MGPCRLRRIEIVACSRAWLRRTALIMLFSILRSFLELYHGIQPKFGPALGGRLEPADELELVPVRQDDPLPGRSDEVYS